MIEMSIDPQKKKKYDAITKTRVCLNTVLRGVRLRARLCYEEKNYRKLRQFYS